MRLAYCWLRLWDGVRFPVKQYRGEIKRLSRHRGGYLDDTCEILFFSISFSFFFSLFLLTSISSQLFFRPFVVPLSFHLFPFHFSFHRPFDEKASSGTLSWRDPIVHMDFSFFFFFFFFSLFDSIRMRLIALKPFLWIKIAIWDASIYTTTYIIQYVCSF